jgi:hypothetical protein
MNMGHDRITFFWRSLLLVCWAISTSVSSFQPSSGVTAFRQVLICNGKIKQQKLSSALQSSIGMYPTETRRSENTNPYWVIKEDEFGSEYLSTNRKKYGHKTLDKAYQRQKEKWADRYTSVDALRETFGSNQNKLWGDLEAGMARRLYKTLLPRALLELSRVGAMPAEDLAPLAYQARVAAKLYTRERCTMPARLGATLYDGFRHWKTYGKFQAHGLTYEQLWEKYAKAILESQQHYNNGEEPSSVNVQVCQKIIERSCQSNERVDSLVLTDDDIEYDENEFLRSIHSQLQRDVYELLLPLKAAATKPLTSIRHFRTLRWMARAKQTFRMKQQQQPERQQLQEATVPNRSVIAKR